MPSESKVIISRVTKYGRKPRTGKEAVRQALALLEDEATNWTTETFFQDGDPQEAYEKAACGSWSACAMGAIGLVTGEMPISVTKIWQEPSDDELLDNWKDAVCADDTVLGFDDWKQNFEPFADYEWDDFSVEPGKNPVSTAAAKVLADALPYHPRMADPLADALPNHPQGADRARSDVDYFLTEGDHMSAVIAFNDRLALGRTDVIALFKMAAAK